MVNHLEVKSLAFISLSHAKYKVFNYPRWLLVWTTELKGKVGTCLESVLWRHRLAFCPFHGINSHSSVIFNAAGSYQYTGENENWLTKKVSGKTLEGGDVMLLWACFWKWIKICVSTICVLTNNAASCAPALTDQIDQQTETQRGKQLARVTRLIEPGAESGCLRPGVALFMMAGSSDLEVEGGPHSTTPGNHGAFGTHPSKMGNEVSLRHP